MGPDTLRRNLACLSWSCGLEKQPEFIRLVLKAVVMHEKTYLLQFRPPGLSLHTIIAASAEIHGEHLVLLNSQGKLAALFVLDMVQSWNEV